MSWYTDEFGGRYTVPITHDQFEVTSVTRIHTASKSTVSGTVSCMEGADLVAHKHHHAAPVSVMVFFDARSKTDLRDRDEEQKKRRYECAPVKNNNKWKPDEKQ